MSGAHLAGVARPFIRAARVRRRLRIQGQQAGSTKGRTRSLTACPWSAANGVAARITLAALMSGAGLAGVGGCDPAAPAVRERSRIGIVKTGDDVRLTGLTALCGWGEGRDNTFMHCLETVVNALGRELDYDELMGLSGMAFRTQFRLGIWDAGNADPLVGADRVRPLLEAIGLDYEIGHPDPANLAEFGRARQSVAASIDYGVPALATNLIPPENWGIITGYRYKGGQKWWCRTYAPSARSVDQLATNFPSALVVLTRVRPRPDLRAARRASIARAVEMADRLMVDGYAQGLRAYDEWCAMLMRAADREYLHPNAWTYVSLIDARAAAVRYLRRLALEFGDRREHLERAAEAYVRQRQTLLSALDAVPWPRDAPVGLPSFSVRQKQINALRAAAQIEAEALRNLRAAR